MIARKVGDQLKFKRSQSASIPRSIDPHPGEKGQSLIAGGAKFRGRAADKLTEGLPTRPWRELQECPFEDLVSPSRVHVDSYGNIHICQGISIGNFWEKPLSEIMAEYHPDKHPICGPLGRKGPAGLIEELELELKQNTSMNATPVIIVRRGLIGCLSRRADTQTSYGIFGELIRGGNNLKSIVVYDSQYGNTKLVAEEIGSALERRKSAFVMHCLGRPAWRHYGDQPPDSWFPNSTTIPPLSRPKLDQDHSHGVAQGSQGSGL